MTLQGKVALITGASRGIGRAVAEAYAAAGAALALCARAVIPAMRRQGGGSIINVSSWLGRNAMEGWGAYGAAKWGLEGLTRYLALELKRDRIRVNSVSPGMVATRMTGFAGQAPEWVTSLFVYLASDASRRVTGRALDVTTWRRELKP